MRLSAIGDVVMASPFIAALRQRFPQARIAWLVQPECAALLDRNCELDEVIVWPRNEWRQLWRERRWRELVRRVWAFRRSMKARRFDLALDLQGLAKSGILTWLSGAPERVGLGSKEGSAHLMSRVVAKPEGDKRIGSEYRHLAEVLGLETEPFRMVVALDDEDEAYAHAFTDRLGGEGYAVLCPFTTRPQKHWLESRWVELIGRLREKFGLQVLMLGGPGDVEAARRLAAAVDGPVQNLVGKTTLRQAAALIKDARVLIGVDTGLTHMAAAFRTPSVALFGATRPYFDADSSGSVVLYHPFACSPCRRRPTCAGAYSCMAALTVDEVISAAAGVTGRRSLDTGPLIQ